MNNTFQVGSVVLVPCKVLGTGLMAYGSAEYVDLLPVTKYGEEYALPVFTVYGDDVIKIPSVAGK